MARTAEALPGHATPRHTAAAFSHTHIVDAHTSPFISLSLSVFLSFFLPLSSAALVCFFSVICLWLPRGVVAVLTAAYNTKCPRGAALALAAVPAVVPCPRGRSRTAAGGGLTGSTTAAEAFRPRPCPCPCPCCCRRAGSCRPLTPARVAVGAPARWPARRRRAALDGSPSYRRSSAAAAGRRAAPRHGGGRRGRLRRRQGWSGGG